jgi:hypothetical protein
MEVLGNLLEYDTSNLEAVADDYWTDASPEEVDAVLAPRFGASEEGYNSVLAEGIEAAAEYFDDVDLYAQGEVYEILDGAGVEAKKLGGGSSGKIASEYTTEDILEEAQTQVEGEVAYVAHPAHAERVAAIGSDMGMGEKLFVPDEVKWPSDDPEPWVRSPVLWAPREVAARTYYRVKSSLPASL